MQSVLLRIWLRRDPRLASWVLLLSFSCSDFRRQAAARDPMRSHSYDGCLTMCAKWCQTTSDGGSVEATKAYLVLLLVRCILRVRLEDVQAGLRLQVLRVQRHVVRQLVRRVHLRVCSIQWLYATGRI